MRMTPKSPASAMVRARMLIYIRVRTIAEAGDFGVIRMVLDDAEKGYRVLKDNAFTVSMTDVPGRGDEGHTRGAV